MNYWGPKEGTRDMRVKAGLKRAEVGILKNVINRFTFLQKPWTWWFKDLDLGHITAKKR